MRKAMRPQYCRPLWPPQSSVIQERREWSGLTFLDGQLSVGLALPGQKFSDRSLRILEAI